MSRGPALAVVALAGLAAWNAAYFFPATVDDAFISLRYAWNLAHGAGLVFNPGERVEGFSNPSWTLLGAVYLKLGWDALIALKWTGIVLSAVTTLLTAWSAAQLGVRGWRVVLAAAVVAVDLNLAFWAPGGLETPLWAALIAAWPGLLARRSAGRETTPWSALVGAAMLVTRPEAPLFVLPVVAIEIGRAVVTPAPRRTLPWLLTLAVPALAWMAFRWGYYGDVVANTYYVKAADGWHIDIFRKYLSSWLAVNSPMTGALLLFAVPLCVATPGAWPVWLAFAMQMVFVMRAGGDWMAQNRFWVPAVPLAAMLLARGTDTLARRLGTAGERAIWACVAALLAIQGWRHLGAELLYLDGGQAIDRPRVTGTTLAARVSGVLQTGVPDRVVEVLLNVPDGAAIAHSEIGLLGFVSDNPVVDAFGLVNRRISGATHEALPEVLESLGDSPPPYLLMREGVPVLSAIRGTAWYARDGYAKQAEWGNVWLEATSPVTPLPPEEAFARLDRAIARVPREPAFHLARIALAREIGDAARERAGCAELATDIPPLATYCGGAPVAAAVSSGVSGAGVGGAGAGPLVPQTGNAGFEEGEAGMATGWESLAPSGSTIVTESGSRVLKVDATGWVCTGWQPMNGDVRIEGRFRMEGIPAGANPRQGAAVGIRQRRADGTFETPVIRAWTGTADWTPFSVTWPKRADMVEYRACVGLNSPAGTVWFDDVAAGSG